MDPLTVISEALALTRIIVEWRIKVWDATPEPLREQQAANLTQIDINWSNAILGFQQSINKLIKVP